MSKPAAVTRLAVASVVLLVLATGCSSSSGDAAPSSAASAAASGAADQSLLDAQQLTVLDQPIKYPTKKAQVTSTIVRLEPGQETGWHKFRVPTYEFVIEGTLTVEYDAGVTKEYPAGTALMQAQGIWLNGSNKGDQAVRVLVVNMGAKGQKIKAERAQ